MSRKRALKKRADFRKGGFVDRKKFQSGGLSPLLDPATKDDYAVKMVGGKPAIVNKKTGESVTGVTPTATTTPVGCSFLVRATHSSRNESYIIFTSCASALGCIVCHRRLSTRRNVLFVDGQD